MRRGEHPPRARAPSADGALLAEDDEAFALLVRAFAKAVGRSVEGRKLGQVLRSAKLSTKTSKNNEEVDVGRSDGATGDAFRGWLPP